MCFQRKYTMTFWEVLKIPYFDQKQAFNCLLLKSCYQKFSKIHSKTSVLESLFNNVPDLQLQCFPENVTKFM